MNTTELANLAATIDTAALNAKAIPQLSKQSKFSEKEAYAIQKASIDRRYERGERLVGLKMGFTSKAKMEQMGVHDMIWGRLTNKMHLENGIVDIDSLIHPRAEPEICFWVRKTIDRKLSLKEAQANVIGVASALEIIDSRYENFKFSLEDVIADNCSSAGFVFGKWHRPQFPIDNLKMDLEIDGEIIHTGSSKAILDNPWEAFIAATRLAEQYKQIIPAGSFIMAGAATAAVYLERGQSVRAKVERLGDVGIFTV